MLSIWLTVHIMLLFPLVPRQVLDGIMDAEMMYVHRGFLGIIQRCVATQASGHDAEVQPTNQKDKNKSAKEVEYNFNRDTWSCQEKLW